MSEMPVAFRLVEDSKGKIGVQCATEWRDGKVVWWNLPHAYVRDINKFWEWPFGLPPSSLTDDESADNVSGRKVD